MPDKVLEPYHGVPPSRGSRISPAADGDSGRVRATVEVRCSLFGGGVWGSEVGVWTGFSAAVERMWHM